MSWPERLVRGHKRRVDYAIHRAYSQLTSDPLVIEKFHELLSSAHKRAPRLFEAPVVGHRHLGVEALVNLSRFHGAHLCTSETWSGTTGSWRCVVSSLAQHLLGGYKVPAFLASAWYSLDATADTKRQWFVAHSRGARFRSLNLPIIMTRKMEHIFLASQDHFAIEYALRRAELLALGTPINITNAILSSRLATDLEDGEFWRTVWLWFTANAREVDPIQIGPMLDYIHAIRCEQAALASQDATRGFLAPQPAFSIKGRTVFSLTRSMRAWHRALGDGDAALRWTPAPFQPLTIEERYGDEKELRRRWYLTELTNSTQLRREGAALHHCVASYADRCHRGVSSIWSLRMSQGEKLHHVLTIEVDPHKRAIIQTRGHSNRAASGRPLSLLKDWAVQERLRFAP